MHGALTVISEASCWLYTVHFSLSLLHLPSGFWHSPFKIFGARKGGSPWKCQILRKHVPRQKINVISYIGWEGGGFHPPPPIGDRVKLSCTESQLHTLWTLCPEISWTFLLIPVNIRYGRSFLILCSILLLKSSHSSYPVSWQVTKCMGCYLPAHITLLPATLHTVCYYFSWHQPWSIYFL